MPGWDPHDDWERVLDDLRGMGIGEEDAQDALIALWLAGLSGKPPPKKVRPWLLRVARRREADRWREHERQARLRREVHRRLFGSRAPEITDERADDWPEASLLERSLLIARAFGLSYRTLAAMTGLGRGLIERRGRNAVLTLVASRAVPRCLVEIGLEKRPRARREPRALGLLLPRLSAPRGELPETIAAGRVLFVLRAHGLPVRALARMVGYSYGYIARLAREAPSAAG